MDRALVRVTRAQGEARIPRAVRVGTEADARAALDVARTEAADAADRGACDDAWARWRGGRHHLRAEAREADDAAVRTHVAACFARAAEAATDRAEAVTALVAARRVDPRDPTLLDTGGRLGAAWAAAGASFESAGDHPSAYAAYRDAIAADPTRSWTRRDAESARDRILGLRGDEAVEDDGSGPGD